MKKAIDFFTAHPARFFLVAALFWGGFMCYLNSKDVKDFSWHDLLVEANGMVFDLLVFGILLSIYERLREKRDKIERLHEEIDDYRGWDEKEATYRIVGAIKRLNKLGVSKINLRYCYLKEANLIRADLQGADFQGADLQRASLREANLREANFQGVNLEGANLLLTNLQGAKLSLANLERTDLRRVNLKGADFFGAKLQGAKVDEDWFKKLEEWEVEGREEIKAKYLIDENGVLREKQ